MANNENTIVVRPNQSLFDLALQHYGHLEGVFDLVQRNGLNGIMDRMEAGEVLRAGQAERYNGMVEFLANHTLATMVPALQADGIGWMEIGKSFSVANPDA